MANAIRASILIPTRDRFLLIRACLESLAKANGWPDIEILLGDTGSKDPDVFSLYDRFAAQFPGRFEVLTLAKYHFSANNNVLAEKASGHSLVFLNNDTIARPGWLEPLLNYLDRPGVGIAGSKLLYASNDRVQHAGIEFVRKGPFHHLGYHPYKNRRPNMPEVNYDKYMPAVTGACLAIRKDKFLRVGGFETAYREEAQDTDLCLKIRKNNQRCVFASQSVLYHLENGSREISEQPSDRKLFVKRWRDFIDHEFFSCEHQSAPIEAERTRVMAARKQVLVERNEARGDVFASTAIIREYRERNPGSHITYKTRYPELVDGLPFIDRALGPEDIDDFKYDVVLNPSYEDGGWRNYSHTFIEEMARTIGLAPSQVRDFRPVYQFNEFDDKTRKFYREFSGTHRYLVIATGAGWREKEWEPLAWEQLAAGVKRWGYECLQIGGSRDYWVKGARHLFDRDLHENLAIVESARAMITVDSFPYHLGLAMGLPIILLTCKTCTHTTFAPSFVKEVRHRNAVRTPLPGCRFMGCRQKFGEGLENSCATPILRALPSEVVLETLSKLLDREPTREINRQLEFSMTPMSKETWI